MLVGKTVVTQLGMYDPGSGRGQWREMVWKMTPAELAVAMSEFFEEIKMEVARGKKIDKQRKRSR